jgi:hypothetical protein
MLINFPLLTIVDDSGAIVSGATVTITSVLDRDGSAVATPGATLHQSGANVSVEYDAEARGEAWITLAISKEGSTFTGERAAPSFFLASDSSRIAGVDAAVDDSQSVGTVVSSSAAGGVTVLTVSGLTIPATNCGAARVDVMDATTGDLKAVALVAGDGGAVSGSNVALTLTSLLSSINPGDTVTVF